jgi:hypothetical protein
MELKTLSFDDERDHDQGLVRASSGTVQDSSQQQPPKHLRLLSPSSLHAPILPTPQTVQDHVRRTSPPHAPSLADHPAPQPREAVFPTRQSLAQMKSKLKGAQVGHDLLKRKSEALTLSVPLPSPSS